MKLEDAKNIVANKKRSSSLKPDLSLSREMSLEKVEDNQEGVSDRYLNLRKSIKDLHEEFKFPIKKSTFKIRKRHSGNQLSLNINTKF